MIIQWRCESPTIPYCELNYRQHEVDHAFSFGALNSESRAQYFSFHHCSDVDHRRLKKKERIDKSCLGVTVEMWTYWCVLPYCSGDFKRRLPRTPSTGTMSSADDLDEREPPSPSDNGELQILHQPLTICASCSVYAVCCLSC